MNDDRNLADALQKLYDAERNVEIASFWDAGWTVKLGDPMNMFTETKYCDKASEIVDIIEAWNAAIERKER